MYLFSNLFELNNYRLYKEKIDTQGGIDSALKVDKTDSAIKAATQMDVIDKNLKATGEADKGLKEPIDNLTKAIDKLASTSGTMAAGKTASDMAKVSHFDNAKDYIENERQKGSKIGASERTAHDWFNNKDNIQNMVQDQLRGQTGAEQNAIKKDLAQSGMITLDDKGKITDYASGQKARDAWAKLGALDMDSTKQLMAGGFSFNIDRSPFGGVNRVSATNVNSLEKGDKTKFNVAHDMNRAAFRAALPNASKEEIEQLTNAAERQADQFIELKSGKGALVKGQALIDAGKQGALKVAEQKFGKDSDVYKKVAEALKIDPNQTNSIVDGNEELIYGGAVATATVGINKATKAFTGKSLVDRVRGSSTSDTNPISKSQEQTNGNQQQNSRNDNTHKNSSQKFVDDGYGGKKPNPNYKPTYKDIISENIGKINKNYGNIIENGGKLMEKAGRLTMYGDAPPNCFLDGVAFFSIPSSSLGSKESVK